MSDELVEAVHEDAEERMAKARRHTRQEFAGVRSGRANSGLVEKLPVEYYGSTVPLQQLASFSVPEARMLVISPFDKGSITAIERAIRDANLGPQPVERRRRHPPGLPAADRGAPQGVRADGAPEGRGRPERRT